jgi:methylenetetrahydrofolate reductase (NADPH)
VLRNLLSRDRSSTTDAHEGAGLAPTVAEVVRAACFECIPLKNLEAQADHLPAGTRVSMTCSPAKGMDATVEGARSLRARGLLVTAHVAARTIRDRSHLSELIASLRACGVDEAFVIAGDAEQAAGTYDGALGLLRDLVTLDHGLARIGVAGYPDGHPLLDAAALHDALAAKDELLHDAGVHGWVSTQMCFDPVRIAAWLREERVAGLRLPVRLGLPGPIERTKLMTMGMRVGVGQSLRYLQKQKGGIVKLLTDGAYDPTELLAELGDDLVALRTEGMHLFTFNQLEACLDWQHRVLELAAS